MRARLLVCTALAFAAAVSLASAQESRMRRPLGNDPLTVSADILEASRLLSVNPEAGVALLRQLNARFPGRDDILSRLGYGMQVVGKADSAVFYYRAALQANPLNLDAGKALGSIYFSEGREDDAMRVFNGVLEANKYSVASYKIVSDALRDLGRADQAIAVLESGRNRSQKNQSLTLEIASLYKQTGDTKRALDEYLSFVVAEPRGFRVVRSKMLEALRDAGNDQDEMVAYLTTRADRGGAEGHAAMDVLAAHFLERGLLEKSLDMALRAESGRESDGGTLLALAEDAMNRVASLPRTEQARHLDLALRASEAFVNDHANAPGIDRARWILAQVYVAYGSGANPAIAPADRAAYLERAVQAYEDISRRYPGSDLAEQAYIERGDVLLRKLKRPDDALAAYKSGAVNARRLGGTFASRIAAVYIGTDRTADADRYLAALSRADNPELAQAGWYYTGIYLATKKNYTAARDTLTALAEAAPASLYTNDAIDAAWIFEEGMMYKSSSLDDIVAAMKADMRGDTTVVVSRLRTIVGRVVDDPIRPRALHRLGLVLFDQGSYDAALATLRQFLHDYPSDEGCPEVQRDIGRVYESGMGNYEKALHEYEQVLLSYPEYAMLDDVRRDVKRVKSIVGESYAP